VRAPSRTVIAHYALNGQMRSKAQSALNCAFGFTSYKDLQTRYEKNHFQWPKAEKTFFYCHSSPVKGAMNAACLCKLRNGVKKCLNFFFFQWPKVDQVSNEYSPQLSKLMA
jgi:hypothetical protein